MSAPFRIEFVAGVTPDKWLRRWDSRMPDSPIEAVAVDDDPTLASLRSGEASMSLVRLPVDRSGLHLIPLYEELPVVVAPKDHPVAAFDEVDIADLADEVLLQPPDEVPEWRAVAGAEALGRTTAMFEAMPAMTAAQVVEVVAAGSGIAILPMSVARLHHRSDVVRRPVTGVAGSGVGLAWRVDDEDPRIEVFVGIVRGRTERSSRGPSTAGGDSDEQPSGRGAGRRSEGGQDRHGRTASRGGSGRALPQRGAAPRRGGRRGTQRRRGR